MRKSTLIATTALVATLFTGNAFAQGATSATEIEELVVTAEKREQSLQDVPVAISALLLQLGIWSASRPSKI